MLGGRFGSSLHFSFFENLHLTTDDKGFIQGVLPDNQNLLNYILKYITQHKKQHVSSTEPLSITAKKGIHTCLNAFPAHLYQPTGGDVAFDDNGTVLVDTRNTPFDYALAFSQSNGAGYGHTMYYTVFNELADYLLKLGAGIGLLKFSNTPKLFSHHFKNADYPTQLFLGASRKVKKYFDKNQVFEPNDLAQLLQQNKLTPQDKDRLKEQAIRAKQSKYFEGNLMVALTEVLGLLKHPLFLNERIRKAYIEHHEALIVFYLQGAKSEKDLAVFNLIFKELTQLNLEETKQLAEVTMAINQRK